MGQVRQINRIEGNRECLWPTGEAMAYRLDRKHAHGMQLSGLVINFRGEYMFLPNELFAKKKRYQSIILGK